MSDDLITFEIVWLGHESFGSIEDNCLPETIGKQEIRRYDLSAAIAAASNRIARTHAHGFYVRRKERKHDES